MIISCVSFFPETPPDFAQRSGTAGWRFRGMATVAEHRNRGVGGELLEAGVAEVRARGGTVVWCNGRTGAADFYRRHGFVSRGEEFDPPRRPALSSSVLSGRSRFGQGRLSRWSARWGGGRGAGRGRRQLADLFGQLGGVACAAAASRQASRVRAGH
jgi:hypothetical protein